MICARIRHLTIQKTQLFKLLRELYVAVYRNVLLIGFINENVIDCSLDVAFCIPILECGKLRIFLVFRHQTVEIGEGRFHDFLNSFILRLFIKITRHKYWNLKVIFVEEFL